ncbi:MAG: hypothetical protein ACTSU6_06090, partial [Candidatus Njordarchaeales archaeon]
FIEKFFLPNIEHDELGYPLVRGPEVPFLPDFGVEDWKTHRLTVMDKSKEWQLIYKYPEVTLGTRAHYAPRKIEGIGLTTKEASEYRRVRGRMLRTLISKYYKKLDKMEPLELQMAFTKLTSGANKTATNQILILRQIEEGNTKNKGKLTYQ